MRKFLTAGFLIIGLIAPRLRSDAQDNPVVFKGALIYPVTGAPIERGILIVQNGRILAIGDASTPTPSGAQVIDASNKVIMPGIVDTHSHIGSPEG